MNNVVEITDKTTWEEFLLSRPLLQTPFFQSWNWGEMQQSLGNSIFRLGMYNGKILVGVCLVVEIKAKRAHYLHLRHGPVLKDLTHFDEFIHHIKKIAKDQNADFLRISPLFEKDTTDIGFFRKRGFRNAPIHNMDAENTWVLDLDSSEEDILKNMRKSTRYLVRKAPGLNLDISQTSKEENFEAFMKLYKDTSKRHGFVPHRGIREEFKVFSQNGEAILFLAKYEGKVLSGAVIIFYGNQAVYHHGASADEHKEIPAAYLIQWEAIKEAKKRGKKVYNFFGIVPPEKPKHPWQGLTLFKTGFGGRRVNFIHAQDLPLTPLYWKSYAIETIWRIKRGY